MKTINTGRKTYFTAAFTLPQHLCKKKGGRKLIIVALACVTLCMTSGDTTW